MSLIKKKTYLTVLIALLIGVTGYSQVLLSVLFGDNFF